MIQNKKRILDSSKLDYSKINFVECDFTNDNWINSIIDSIYDRSQISFNSLLGISYYLTKEEFFDMIHSISSIMCEGSSIVFDYPTYEDGEEMKTNEKLANGANEQMKSKYSYKEIENILSENGLLIYEHLNNEEMTNTYFDDYNTLNPSNKITAPKGVCFCLAVKK